MAKRNWMCAALAAAAGMFVAADATRAAILARYEFPGGSATPTAFGTGVTAGNMTASITDSTQGFSSFSNNIFLRSQATGADQAAALADANFFSVTISATNVGLEELNLTSLTLLLGATTDNANAFNSTVYLQSSVGGTGTGNPVVAGTHTTFSIAAATPLTFNGNATTFDLTGASFQGLSTITFHIRLSDNRDENGKINRIDDVTVNGTVDPVPEDPVIPEPASLAFCALGLLVMLPRRRRA